MVVERSTRRIYAHQAARRREINLVRTYGGQELNVHEHGRLRRGHRRKKAKRAGNVKV